MRTLVLYHSKTGFTERYAVWLAEELQADLVSYAKRKSVVFSQYDTVIYGGGFHAGLISGLGWLKKRLHLLIGKKVIVFATGATPAEAKEVETALAQNFTDEERAQVRLFYLQSGLCYEKMGTLDRLMMAVFRTMLKKTEGESDAYRAVQHSFDVCTKEALLPLLNEAKSTGT